MKSFTAILFVFVLSACSNQAMYKNIQSKNRSDCQKHAPGDYDACVKRTEKTYEEYKRERDEALKD